MFHFSLALLPLLVVHGSAATLNHYVGRTAECEQACTQLRSLLPYNTSYDNATTNPYWAGQIQEIQPACFFAPANAAEVSTIVKTVKKNGCQFAIRSGGHSGVPGASNLAGGLVVDLGRMREVTLSADKQSVRVGAGNRWGDVYSRLDPLNITVVGGRAATVGVGGLLVGGGLSYFSGQYGLACDNVLNYEVVLADGSIVNANADSPKYADLSRALRGGTNNFGIVTRFDLKAYSYDGINGGSVVWSDSPQVESSLLDAFVSYARQAPQDPHAHSFLAIVGLPSSGHIWAGGLYYTKPYTTPRPSIFDPYFTPSLNSAQLVSTLRNTNHTALAVHLAAGQPDGPRQRFFTNTYRLDRALLSDNVAIYREELARGNAALNAKGYANASWSYALQHLTSNILAPGSSGSSRNVLGLSPSDAPLALVSMASPSTSPEEDAIIFESMQRVIDRTDDLARKRGLAHPFKYANYAQPGARVFEGYGKEQLKFLRRVSKKVDPEGVWQRLVPGGFKL